MNPHPSLSSFDNRVSHTRFAQLIQPHQAGLHSRALHLTRNRADAEDLVQETLLRAYKCLDNLTNTSSLKAWLHTIQLNLFRRRYCVARRFMSQSLDEDFVASVPSAPNLVESEIFTEMRREAVLHALHHLPPLYREPVLMFSIEGRSYQEIAEHLNIPVGTVRSRINRGRRQLQRALSMWLVAEEMH